MEVAVAAGGDRGGGDLTVGGEGEGEPGLGRFEDAVEVGGAEEVALGSGGAAHRLLVGGEEAGALRRRSSPGPEPAAARSHGADSC